MIFLNFKLKQHTPIIHFQSGQQGATIRVSEVKPKLDRYLLTELGIGSYSKGFEFAKKKGWLLRNCKHGALDYKLKLAQSTSVENVANPTFFGKDKSHLYSNSEVTGIFSFPGKYRPGSDFRKQLLTFFLINNFGCRNGKGAGSFTLSSFDNIPVSIAENMELLKSKDFKTNFRTVFKDHLAIETNDHTVIFKTIDYYYKRLKSGVNYTYDDETAKECKGEYKKSILINHIDGYTWEKRWLKEEFMKLTPDPDLKKPKFVRALLGLPDKYSFMDKSRLKKYNNEKTKKALDFKFEVSVKSDEIQRIPSPIIFKPITESGQTYIFLLVENDYPGWKILDKSFHFQMLNLEFPLFYDETNLDRKGNYRATIIKKHEKRWENELIKKHSEFISNHTEFEDQSEALRNFFKYREPEIQNLSTPPNGINLFSLLSEFHLSLGESFTAVDFRNKMVSEVQIVKF